MGREEMPEIITIYVYKPFKFEIIYLLNSRGKDKSLSNFDSKIE